MIGWLRRHMGFLDRRAPDPATIVPTDPAQAETLRKADALLASPRVRRLMDHQHAMRGSFRRAGDRLGTR